MRIRLLVLGEEADGRKELAGRVLSVDAIFDGMALYSNIFLLVLQFVASRDKNLLLHKVDARDLLRNGVLDLQTSVHLEEVEIFVDVHQELYGTGRVVVAGASESDSLVTHPLASSRVHSRARCLLDNLLVAALDRAFALWQPHIVVVHVAENLELDMSRRLDVLLNEDATVAERADGLLLGELEAFLGLLVIECNSHALAATASRGLDHDRVADLV
mmetsp:Transcript_15057/g.20450  ORF Transcript_15057/g.20450 Transcript_15057/m.20450 type:complete len:217 (-) Transcript_15057:517-1167(-)